MDRHSGPGEWPVRRRCDVRFAILCGIRMARATTCACRQLSSRRSQDCRQPQGGGATEFGRLGSNRRCDAESPVSIANGRVNDSVPSRLRCVGWTPSSSHVVPHWCAGLRSPFSVGESIPPGLRSAAVRQRGTRNSAETSHLNPGAAAAVPASQFAISAPRFGLPSLTFRLSQPGFQVCQTTLPGN